jgi:hypothetical protein
MGHLGVVLLDQGDPAAAQPYLARALAIHHEMLGNEHPYTARSLDQLSRCLQARGHDQSARRHRELALRIYRQILGTEHPYTVAVMRRDDQTTR